MHRSRSTHESRPPKRPRAVPTSRQPLAIEASPTQMCQVHTEQLVDAIELLAHWMDEHADMLTQVEYANSEAMYHFSVYIDLLHTTCQELFSFAPYIESMDALIPLCQACASLFRLANSYYRRLLCTVRVSREEDQQLDSLIPSTMLYVCVSKCALLASMARHAMKRDTERVIRSTCANHMEYIIEYNLLLWPDVPVIEWSVCQLLDALELLQRRWATLVYSSQLETYVSLLELCAARHLNLTMPASIADHPTLCCTVSSDEPHAEPLYSYSEDLLGIYANTFYCIREELSIAAHFPVVPVPSQCACTEEQEIAVTDWLLSHTRSMSNNARQSFRRVFCEVNLYPGERETMTNTSFSMTYGPEDIVRQMRGIAHLKCLQEFCVKEDLEEALSADVAKQFPLAAPCLYRILMGEYVEMTATENNSWNHYCVFKFDVIHNLPTIEAKRETPIVMQCMNRFGVLFRGQLYDCVTYPRAVAVMFNVVEHMLGGIVKGASLDFSKFAGDVFGRSCQIRFQQKKLTVHYANVVASKPVLHNWTSHSVLERQKPLCLSHRTPNI